MNWHKQLEKEVKEREGEAQNASAENVEEAQAAYFRGKRDAYANVRRFLSVTPASDEHLEAIGDLLRRFVVLGDHYPIVGRATRHTVDDQAAGQAASQAWREAAEYLRDMLRGITTPDEEEE